MTVWSSSAYVPKKPCLAGEAEGIGSVLGGSGAHALRDIGLSIGAHQGLVHVQHHLSVIASAARQMHTA